jgi:hypothetical protein
MLSYAQVFNDDNMFWHLIFVKKTIIYAISFCIVALIVRAYIILV